jgi:lipid A 4'-phosphatase
MRPPILGLTLPAWLILTSLTLLLVSLTLWPSLDLTVSGLFYQPETGFAADRHWFFLGVHAIAFWGARLLGMTLLAGLVLCLLWRRPIFGIKRKALLFLLLALIIGPGLVANEIFKDEWGRPRPRTVTEFGGPLPFTPPLVLSNHCARNCSFVSGDASFGFYLPSLALVAAAAWRRRLFWGGIAAGSLFGFTRIAMGAHFFSDVIYAGLFMLLTSSVLYTLLYGRSAARQVWQDLGFRRNN